MPKPTELNETVPNDNVVKFKMPLELAGGQQISEVLLIEPKAGTMKGINRYGILTMADDEHKKLIPRISQPCITAVMFDQLSLKDSQKLMTKVVGFFADETDFA